MSYCLITSFMITLAWSTAHSEVPLPPDAVLSGQLRSVQGISFIPGGHDLLCGSEDGVVRRWDCDHAAMSSTIQVGAEAHLKQQVHCRLPLGLSVLQDFSRSSSIALWDYTKNVVFTLRDAHLSFIRDAAFHPSEPILVTVSGARISELQPDDFRVRLWRLAGLSVSEERTIPYTGASLETIRFSRDGRLLIGGNTNGDIQIWETQSGRQVATVHTGIVESISEIELDESTGTMFVCGPERGVQAFDSCTFLQRWSHCGHTRATAFHALAHRDFVLLGLADSTIQVLSMDRGIVVGCLTGPSGWIYAMDSSSDGKLVAAGCFDGKVALWTIDKIAAHVRRPQQGVERNIDHDGVKPSGNRR